MNNRGPGTKDDIVQNQDQKSLSSSGNAACIALEMVSKGPSDVIQNEPPVRLVALPKMIIASGQRTITKAAATDAHVFLTSLMLSMNTHNSTSPAITVPKKWVSPKAMVDAIRPQKLRRVMNKYSVMHDRNRRSAYDLTSCA